MASDLKERLLPPKPAIPTNRPIFQGLDLSGLKKRGHGVRSWIRIYSSGDSQVVELDKLAVMRRCDLPARDLRLLDPLFVYPSTILGRERAIVVNLEQIRCIITADEVLLLNSLDSYVLQYVVELQRRLGFERRSFSPSTNNFEDGFGGSSPTDGLPFEFRALEVALESACTFLDSQVRDEIEQLMDDDGDMAEMYLTEKKLRMDSTCGDQSLIGYGSVGVGISVSAPVSPVSSPPESRRLEKSLSIGRSRHESIRSTESGEDIEELEMLLETYFVVIGSTLNKLTSLKEYIDDTEDFINIQLDNVRNQLIQFELLLTTATFVVAIFGVVAGIFGMNFSISLFDEPDAFKWVLLITGVCGLLIFCGFVWFFRYKRLMPL
ncbi:unnamed protein product [Victoria cruziana]